MKGKLKQLSKKEMRQIVPNLDIRDISRNEPIFIITKKSERLNNDPLINLEISFRKCERLGVFLK